MNRINTEEVEDIAKIAGLPGYKWPAFSLWEMNYSIIFKDPEYWTEPEKFNPDRFYYPSSDEFKKERNQHKCAFTMFGGGLRICPGRKLAMIELKSLMVLLYRKYDVELVNINAPLKIKSVALNTCKELPVKIRKKTSFKQ